MNNLLKAALAALLFVLPAIAQGTNPPSSGSVSAQVPLPIGGSVSGTLNGITAHLNVFGQPVLNTGISLSNSPAGSVPTTKWMDLFLSLEVSIQNLAAALNSANNLPAPTSQAEQSVRNAMIQSLTSTLTLLHAQKEVIGRVITGG